LQKERILEATAGEENPDSNSMELDVMKAFNI